MFAKAPQGFAYNHAHLTVPGFQFAECKRECLGGYLLVIASRGLLLHRGSRYEGRLAGVYADSWIVYLYRCPFQQSSSQGDWVRLLGRPYVGYSMYVSSVSILEGLV